MKPIWLFNGAGLYACNLHAVIAAATEIAGRGRFAARREAFEVARVRIEPA